MDTFQLLKSHLKQSAMVWTCEDPDIPEGTLDWDPKNAWSEAALFYGVHLPP